LGIDPASEAGQRIVHGAFEPYWRDSGLHPNDERSENIEYNRYLRNLGYEGKNPWHTHANGAIDEAGHFRSGWFNENVKYPANIKEEHSETPYATSRAMEFIENASDQPWCLHLSYIKPHWPYIAPAPYHNMYGLEHIIPLNRDETEKENPHPVLGAFQKHLAAEGFSTTEMQEAVIPVYMGLIKQIDDQIGRLLDFLEARGDLDNTFIVFTSDHGDYLGDHWLGDKDFFHEESVRVPLIVVDPRSEADATRGTVETRLVESIDYVPTFVDVMGGTPSHRLEGHSLIPLLHGHENVTWRDYVISEVDFSDRQANNFLDLPPVQCRTVMVRTESWKYIAFNGFRPMLFDLENDPQELQDLGADPACEQIRQDMQANLADWSLQRHTQVSLSHQVFEERKWQYHREKIGVYIGFWSEDDLPDTVKQSKSQ
ncbi:MAG: sulfatase-like hydrolase/transferase, partial [Chloroflexota bacterium]